MGPNGSGKSNVADAIVWAAGSLTPSELRAEKPDDVLFGGSSTRPAADHCEVELLFDNEDGGFGEEVDFNEIAITRRLVRGGEGQYLVNKAPVRRTDLVELLADVGLGGSMHSIVSQGKVDAVLASKPEDRRHLVEEAAGLGKFKRRKHRAELKLARVATQVERAKDVEDEVRKRLRPLALQATAAERAEKLAVEIAGLRARIAQLDLAAVAERRADAEAAPRRRRDRAPRCPGEAAALLEERQQAEDELSDAAGGREAALGALYRLQGASERLALRRESAAGLEAAAARGSRRGRARRRRSQRRGGPRARGCRAAAAGAARDAAESTRSGGGAGPPRPCPRRCVRAAPRHRRRGDARRVAHRARRRRGALAEATGGQEGANRRLVALAAARERLGLRRESATALVETLARELEEARAIGPSRRPAPGRARGSGRTTRRTPHVPLPPSATTSPSGRDRPASACRRSSGRSRSGKGFLRRRARSRTPGETLALSALEAEPGAERAVAAALAWRAAAVLARDPQRRARAARADAQRRAREPHRRSSIAIPPRRRAAGRRSARPLARSPRATRPRSGCSTASGSSRPGSCSTRRTER